MAPLWGFLEYDVMSIFYKHNAPMELRASSCRERENE